MRIFDDRDFAQTIPLGSAGRQRAKSQIEVVENQGDTGHAGADDLELRRNDAGNRRYDERRDRHDIREKDSVQRREDLVADVPAEHADETGNQAHVKQVGNDRSDIGGARYRHHVRGEQQQVDGSDGRQPQPHRHCRVFEDRPSRKLRCAERVDDPRQQPQQDQGVGGIVTGLFQQAVDVSLGDDEGHAAKRQQHKQHGISRRQHAAHDRMNQQSDHRLGRRHDRGRQGTVASGLLLAQEDKKTKAGKADRAKQPRQCDRLALGMQCAGTFLEAKQDKRGRAGDQVSQGGECEGIDVAQRARHHRKHAAERDRCDQAAQHALGVAAARSGRRILVCMWGAARQQRLSQRLVHHGPSTQFRSRQ